MGEDAQAKKDKPPVKDEQARKRTEEIKGWLGRGIDLFQFDPFAAVKSAKPTRILVEQIPEGVINKLPLRATGYQEKYADSLLEISHKLTVEAGMKGSYGGFSGSVNSKFGITEKRTEKRHLLKISFVVSGDSYNITRDKEALKKLLNEDFKNALAKWDVDELFEDYGTHLIKKMIIGGRAEYFCQSSDITSISERDFKIASKFKYKRAGGSLEGTNDVTTADRTKLNLVEGSESIETIGGSGEAAMNLKEGKWAEWAESCEKYPAFLNFDIQDGLLPIWDLAADTARRELIHEAYKRKAAKALRTEILSATSPDVKKDPEARVEIPENYKLLSGGARDNWKEPGNMLTASFPESDNIWRASGHDLGVYGPESITAFAVAIYDPDDLWEVKIFKKTSSEDFKPMMEVAVDPGYVMVGGGAQAHFSRNPLDPSLLFASYPKDERTWRAHSKEHWKESPATMTVYAIGLKCKVKGIAVRQEIKNSASNDSRRPDAEATAPQGYAMTGGGAVLNFDFGGRNWHNRGTALNQGLLLTQSYPNAHNKWYGAAKDHHYQDSTSIDVQCIGVKVVDAP